MPKVLTNQPWPSGSFAAQLLALGLHHDIPELVRKAEDAATHLDANTALRFYEQAQGNYIADERAALLLRFSA